MQRTFQRLSFTSLIVTMLLSSAVVARTSGTTSFYVVAHEDDWQLFMNPNAWKGVRLPGAKAVFVYTTAGDAGTGTGTGDHPIPFYVAREQSARRAVRFMADAGNTGESDRRDSVVVNGKTLHRYLYKNTVSYFLRLPDGNVNGAGFPSTGNQSLERLYNSAIPTITSVDGSLTFAGWADLTQTLMELTLQEAAGSANVWVNVQDPYFQFNPIDHSDHRHTGIAMLQAVGPLPCIHKVLYVDYHTALLPKNLNTKSLIIEAAVWGVTTSTLSDLYHSNTFDFLHNSWLGRNYFRVETGSGGCSF